MKVKYYLAHEELLNFNDILRTVYYYSPPLPIPSIDSESPLHTERLVYSQRRVYPLYLHTPESFHNPEFIDWGHHDMAMDPPTQFAEKNTIYFRPHYAKGKFTDFAKIQPHRLSFFECATEVEPSAWPLTEKNSNHTMIEEWIKRPQLVLRHEPTRHATELPCDADAFEVTAWLCNALTPTLPDATNPILEHRVVASWEMAVNEDSPIMMMCTNPDMPHTYHS